MGVFEQPSHFQFRLGVFSLASQNPGKCRLWDSHPFEMLWKNLYGPLRGFILSRVRQESIADDVIQEVFLKIQLNIDRLRNPEKINQWLFQIARNAIIDHFRQNKRDSETRYLTVETEEQNEQNLNLQLAN